MTVLDDIIVGVRADMEERRQRVTLSDLETRIQSRRAALDALEWLRTPHLSVISEVKRSSPSKGALADITDPAGLAAEYQRGGASAVSVLTEKHRFNGSLADLDAVRAALDIPVLRKDFVVDDYQVLEARAHGADLVLLIVAALDDAQLAHLYQMVTDLGMTALVEVHTADETRRAVDLGAQLIGVNNRNLKTLEVDLAQFGRLVHLIPEGTVTVAESGVFTPEDAALVRSQGADAILCGEALVRHGDPAAAIRAMVEAAASHSH